MPQNVLQHTDTSNTGLLISKQDINPLYRFSHCIDSFQNFLVTIYIDKLGSFNDLTM